MHSAFVKHLFCRIISFVRWGSDIYNDSHILASSSDVSITYLILR